MDGQLAGARYANISMIACLVLCSLLTFLIKEDLKRYRVEKGEQSEEKGSEEESDEKLLMQ